MAEFTSSLIITLEMDVQVKGIALWDTVCCVECCIFWQINYRRSSA